MFEQPSLTLIRSLLAGSSAVPSPTATATGDSSWSGQRSQTAAISNVHSSEFEPSLSAPVRCNSEQSVMMPSHLGHWSSSYTKIASSSSPLAAANADRQSFDSSSSQPPSVQILTPPSTLSPSPPQSPVVSQQQMSLATRRQIDEFEELIEKIDRLNGMQNDADSRTPPPFMRSSSNHDNSNSSNNPNLTALLVQSSPHRPATSSPLTSYHLQIGGGGNRTVSAIDDDFEILLEENPSLLDPTLSSAPNSTNSSSMRMMMDTLEMCLRSAPLTCSTGANMFSFGTNNELSVCKNSGHNVTAAADHSCGQEKTMIKQEMDDEFGRTNSSSFVRQDLASPIPTRYFGPPTSLKSATMTTRTNLKQLLQMQQFHEMERREQSKGGMSTSPVAGGGAPSASGPFTTTTSVNVPMQPILPSRMEVPSEILKVHSQLENPTRYHVQENRKRQVQEYLSTTQGNARSILAQSVPVGVKELALGGGSGVGGATGTSAPSMCGNNNNAVVATSGRSPDSPNSVILSSSAATSVTSEADVIESIMQLESSMDTDHAAYLLQPSTLPTSANFLDVLKMSSAKSCPPDVPVSNIDGLHLTNVQLHAIAKDRQKKDNHNMIERRRRFNINDRIKELGTLLPRSSDPYYDMIRIDRQNKGTILKATVDYVKQMKKELDRVKLELGEKDQENRKLRLQNVQLAAMHSHSSGSSGVEVNWPDSLTGLSSAYAKEELQIKEEPLDSSSADHFHQQVSPFEDLMDEDEPVHGDPLLSSSMLGNTL